MSFRRNSFQFRMGRKTGADGSHAAAADSVALITDTWISSPFLLLPPSLPPSHWKSYTGRFHSQQSINQFAYTFIFKYKFFFILGGGKAIYLFEKEKETKKKYVNDEKEKSRTFPTSITGNENKNGG